MPESTPPVRTTTRQSVIWGALGLLGAGVLVGSLATPSADASADMWQRQLAAVAITQSRPYDLGAEAITLEAGGFYNVPDGALLVITEFLPISNTGIQAADQPVLIEIDAFSADWRVVRNSMVALPGEVVRNPNSTRVFLCGYLVDPDSTRTLADIERKLDETNELLTDKLTAIETVLGELETNQPPSASEAEVVDLVATAMGREVGSAVTTGMRDALDELYRRMDRKEREAAQRQSQKQTP